MKKARSDRGDASLLTKRLVLPLLVTACCFAPQCSGAARADLTVVSTISTAQTSPDNTDKPAPAGQAVKVTVYSRGKQARTDIDGGGTTIFDGDQIYVLDNQAKTYYEEPLKNWSAAPPPLLASSVAADTTGQLDVDSDVNMNNTDNTADNSRTLDGLMSKKYLITGWVNVSPQQPDTGPTPPRGGGMGGNGGGGMSFPTALLQESGGTGLLRTAQYGGGHSGGRRSRIMTGGISSTTVSGEVWLAKAVDFVGDKDNSAWAEAVVSSWGVGVLTGDLASKIARERGLPTLARIDFSWTAPQNSANGGSLDNSGGFIQSGEQTTVTTTVRLTSVSESPVDPALFVVPINYSQTSQSQQPEPTMRPPGR